MAPKVSVIIPCYNVEKYLRQCLDSVVNQTLSDIEIICINDGSIDKSLEILNNYASKDPRFIVISQKNQGLSCARNRGLKEVHSPYIYFLDSDDYIEQKLLEKAYTILQNNDVDYYCFGSEPFLETENTSQNYEELEQYLKIKNEGIQNASFDIGQNQNIHVWNKVFKTSIIKQNDIKFVDGLLYEDIYFTWYYFFLSRKVYFEKEILHHYRIHSKSIMDENTKNKTFETAMPHLYNWQELFKRVKKDKVLFKANFKHLKTLLFHYYIRTQEMSSPNDGQKIKAIYNKCKKDLDYEILKHFGIINYMFYKQKFFKIYTENDCKRLSLLGLKIKIKLRENNG